MVGLKVVVIVNFNKRPSEAALHCVPYRMAERPKNLYQAIVHPSWMSSNGINQMVFNLLECLYSSIKNLKVYIHKTYLGRSERKKYFCHM